VVDQHQLVQGEGASVTVGEGSENVIMISPEDLQLLSQEGVQIISQDGMIIIQQPDGTATVVGAAGDAQIQIVDPSSATEAGAAGISADQNSV